MYTSWEFNSDSLYDIMLCHLRDVGVLIAEKARPYLVTIFIQIINTLSEFFWQSASHLLTASYLISICQIRRAVTCPDYIIWWKA